jgi:hypothetical protein
LEDYCYRLKDAGDYRYRLKDVGTPTHFLWAKIGRKVLNGLEYWYISAEAYLEKALDTIEE